MRDAATAAAMSDPDLNRWFRRRWHEPPMRPARERSAKQRRRGDQAPTLSKISLNAKETSKPDARVQRACQIDRLADLLLHLGHHRQAERLAHDAAVLREVAL